MPAVHRGRTRREHDPGGRGLGRAPVRRHRHRRQQRQRHLVDRNAGHAHEEIRSHAPVQHARHLPDVTPSRYSEPLLRDGFEESSSGSVCIPVVTLESRVEASEKQPATEKSGGRFNERRGISHSSDFFVHNKQWQRRSPLRIHRGMCGLTNVISSSSGPCWPLEHRFGSAHWLKSVVDVIESQWGLAKRSRGQRVFATASASFLVAPNGLGKRTKRHLLVWNNKDEEMLTQSSRPHWTGQSCACRT